MELSSENENEENIVITEENASSFSQSALHAILSATKAANNLPQAGDDFDYYSTFQGFRTVMLKEGNSILSLMTSLMQSQGVREKIIGRELEDKFDLLIDVNDAIFENVSNYLDEASGLKKSEEDLLVATKASSINTSWNQKYRTGVRHSQNYALLTAKNITRPQLSFKDKIDNSNSLFVPILKEKPNSIRPLAITIEKNGDHEEFCHPYECEIEKFTPCKEHLQTVEPTIPKPVEETALIFVQETSELLALCKELKKQKEFAVDLEHHSFRSFQGFTCLIQISTRDKDYIIDVFPLRTELHILNEVFTDPKIVKVLHGADMDVLWLQRDFGIYIVNLFDTGQAARVLHFAHLSLSYLLKHYCKLDVDKKFQLADWRIRPLPAEMVKYAREDTHYLLFIYDCMKNNLIDNGNNIKNLLHSTFKRSALVCLKKYEKPLFHEERYFEVYKKTKKIFNPRQLFCLKELYSWRDKIARDYDESLGYVLPNHMLLQIAEALPKEQQGILACCNPIPPFVRQQLNELHAIIYKANGISLMQCESSSIQKKTAIFVNNKVDLNNILYCPHDIHHLDERNVQILNQSNIKSQDNSLTLVPKKRKLLITSSIEASCKEKNTQEKSEDRPFYKVTELLKKLASPFQRYTITKKHNKEKEIQIPAEAHENINTNVVETCDGERYTDFARTKILSTPVPSTSTTKSTCQEEPPATPLRKKNKRKHKSETDIALLLTPKEEEMPPSKKSCTPEVIEVDDEEDNFQPYDYSKSDLSNFSSKNKSRGNQQGGRNQRGGRNNQSKFQGNSWKQNKKHGRQSTFNSHSNPWSDSKSNKKWPQAK